MHAPTITTTEPLFHASWEQQAGVHYENFPVGSLLVPRRLRPHVHRIYAFARLADDLADEQRDAAALAEFRARFTAHLEGRAADVPLFVDLCASIRELALEPQLCFDLLDAFAQDLRDKRHSEASLFAYCRKSADPVGRLVLRVFGHRDPALDALSDQICTGLQLLNHLQDVREDLQERDMIYLPQEDLRRFGVAEQDLCAPRATPQVVALIAHWDQRCAALFAAGFPLCARVRGRLRLELRAILHGAAAVLAGLRACGHDVLATHVRLTRWQKLRALVRALTSSQPPREFG